MINNITSGSKCVVYIASDHSGVEKTSGMFEKFISIGEDLAMVIVLDEAHEELKGKIRIIMVNAISAIDILDLKEEVKKNEEDKATYFT
ncbi:MAG: hypothetical protein ACP5NL_02685 [Thermoplasmata archaeon]